MLWLYSVFFFKQKTAYEMRISDWSSDVCSSDLVGARTDQDVVADRARIRVDDLVQALDLGIRTGHVYVQGGARVTGEAGQHRLQILDHEGLVGQIGRASCRERVCQYV